MGWLARDVDDAIEWSKRQITNPTQSWAGLCQSHVRQAYGVGAWASSAINAWNAIPSKEKTTGSDPTRAPRGAALYYKGGKYGHVALATGRSTSDKCLSNDYVRQGMIDYAPRTFPRWGITYLGWSFWTPYGTLRHPEDSFWDGQVPDIEGIWNAMNDPRLANPAAWRLACRLADLGDYVGEPQPKGVQRYPVRAVANWQARKGWLTAPEGAYSPLMHERVF